MPLYRPTACDRRYVNSMQFILKLKKKRKKSKIRVATLTYIVGRLRLKDTRVTSSSFGGSSC
jgi:hypothetical protein